MAVLMKPYNPGDRRILATESSPKHEFVTIMKNKDIMQMYLETRIGR